MASVLVPLDGSPLAARALPLAVQIAGNLDESLRFIEVIHTPAAPPVLPFAFEDVARVADSYLHAIAGRILDQYGMAAETISAVGYPVDRILKAAAEPDVDLIVMSTHGRGGLLRLVMGSVAEQVVRGSPVPVVLVPSAATIIDRPRLDRIVVPLDGSELAYGVMAPVLKLAQPSASEILLLRVVPYPKVSAESESIDDSILADQAAIWWAEAEAGLTEIRERVALRGPRVRTTVRFGEPAAEIVAFAEEEGADLIALGTHGRSGLTRLRQGSVAESVIRRSRLPVLAFGRTALTRAWQAAFAAVNRT